MANQEERVDRVLRHQIGLFRVGDRTARAVIEVLNSAERDIVGQIIALDPSEVSRDRYKRARLQTLLDKIREINRDIYRQLQGHMRRHVRDLATAEIEFQDGLLRTGTNTALSIVTAEEAYAAAVARPFQGRLLSEMYQGIEAQSRVRLRDAIRFGFLEGETAAQVVKRVRGSAAMGYRDGILEIGRKDAYRVVRTALSHTAAVSREAVNRANADLLQGVIWIATLDSRTSDICRARSQLAYTLDHKPIGHDMAWLGGPGRAHWNCRSTEVVWFKDEDQPEGLSYQKWLERQPAADQKDALGPTKYRLWKEGKVTMDRFVDPQGRGLTIDQLRSREAAAFERLS